MQTNALPLWTFQVGYTLSSVLHKSLAFSSSPGMGTTRQKTSLLLCTACDSTPRHPSSAIPFVVTAYTDNKGKCADPASARPLFSKQVEKDFDQVLPFIVTKLN